MPINTKAIQFIFTLLLCVHTKYSCAQNEDTLKTNYIEKFVQYIDWPNLAPQDSFIITIVGESKIPEILYLRAQKQKIKGRRIIIRHNCESNDLSKTHLLYIVNCSEFQLQQLYSKVKNEPILIVSDLNGSPEYQPHIKFYLNNKGFVHFEINQKKISSSKLSTDMYLLDVARVVKEIK